ncbi:glycosyltransferase [Streptomyces sp. RB6PN25]|uniref:Glycosyltransferase n=1 Tax=Streptomyces humicola TaxID=2953240 RepID=A0ABT1PRW2_9ACTN|nr:glycosyltransferase [Streptomyces humicola]
MDAALFGVDVVPDIEVRGTTWALGSHRPFGRSQAILLKATRRSPALCGALRTFAPDVLIAHFLQCAWRIAHVTKNAGVPLVAMCHGSDLLTLRGSKRRQSRSTRQLAANWMRFVEDVRLFLPVSEFLGTRLLESGVPPSRVAVHYLGVPIPSGDDLGSAAECSAVLFVGRLVESKGCDLLLQAVGDIARGRRVDVTVVGDGPQRSALLKQAAGLPPGARVRFPGSLSQRAVFALMRQHRMLCVPSVDVASGASEGLGLVACEAAAHGRPVIAFDTGGLRETLIHGTTGLLVQRRDRRNLAEALEAILSDDAMAEAMGHAARQLAVEKFDLSRQGRRLFEKLLANGLICSESDREMHPE